MRGDKFAYGWSGHIIARDSEGSEDCWKYNVVIVTDTVFDTMVADLDASNLPAGVHMEKLGCLEIDQLYFLAAGTGFTKAWEHYGAPFEEAELRLVEGFGVQELTPDSLYLEVMKEHYGVDLPPCRLMVGCAAES